MSVHLHVDLYNTSQSNEVPLKGNTCAGEWSLTNITIYLWIYLLILTQWFKVSDSCAPDRGVILWCEGGKASHVFSRSRRLSPARQLPSVCLSGLHTCSLSANPAELPPAGSAAPHPLITLPVSIPLPQHPYVRAGFVAASDMSLEVIA